MSTGFIINLFLLLQFAIFKSTTSLNVEVTTPLGKMLGSTLTTRLGRPIYAFRGIPYAKPPIDALRFQPPVAAEPWTGIYNATIDGPACPQYGTTDPVSEDCLFLNVYTTKPPDSDDISSYSVIVFLHPGGFHEGTGRSNLYGPQYLLDKDVVLVTLNYRLGSLGFISVGKEAPGNNGLKDQVMALRWVQNNIGSFGGDSNAVTLFGYSAGSWSVGLHMVSPMSQGLFHRAIAGSGLQVTTMNYTTNQMNLARRQAQIVGCPDTNGSVILDCLRTKSAQELGNSLPGFAEFGINPIIIFYPVIEEDYGQERFLIDDPLVSISRGDFKNNPVITGITKDELALFAFPLVSNTTLLNELDNNFDEYAPITFCYERGTEKSREVSRNLRSFYFDNRVISNASFENVSEVFSDSIIGYPVDRIVSLLSEKNSEPVYYYLFTYQSPYSNFYFPETKQPYGVVHEDDLMYLFYDSSHFPFFNVSDPESLMVDTLTTMWTNFAKTGNPLDPSSNNLGTMDWIPYNTDTRSYLDIGKQLIMMQNLHQNRYALWRKMFP